jgi:hypothetical protein
MELSGRIRKMIPCAAILFAAALVAPVVSLRVGKNLI